MDLKNTLQVIGKAATIADIDSVGGSLRNLKTEYSDVLRVSSKINSVGGNLKTLFGGAAGATIGQLGSTLSGRSSSEEQTKTGSFVGGVIQAGFALGGTILGGAAGPAGAFVGGMTGNIVGGMVGSAVGGAVSRAELNPTRSSWVFDYPDNWNNPFGGNESVESAAQLKSAVARIKQMEPELKKLDELFSKMHHDIYRN